KIFTMSPSYGKEKLFIAAIMGTQETLQQGNIWSLSDMEWRAWEDLLSDMKWTASAPFI
ncbi:hypothetical protein HN51_047378, partial [Arachis hypogaea]